MTVAKRREREKEERRCSILEAAERVFFTKGFAAATMDEVAAEAEVSKGTLYLYFKSKDELFFALSSPSIERVLTELRDIAARPGSALDRIGEMLKAQCDSVIEGPQRFRIAVMRMAMGFHDVETGASGLADTFAEHHALIIEIVRTYVEVIERGQRDGSIRRDLVPLEVALRLWGGLFGILIMRINFGDAQHCNLPVPVDLERFVSGHISFVCEALGAARTAPVEPTR